MHRPLKIKQFVQYLAPDISATWDCPSWPPDLFAICTALLEKSGAYALIGSVHCPLSKDWENYGSRAEDLYELGDTWRRKWFKHKNKCPKRVRKWWSILKDARHALVSDVRDNEVLCSALINLVAAADEAMAGVGVLESEDGDGLFWAECEWVLRPRANYGSTLCQKICPTRLRVLPKSQTPQSGFSLRSISHYMSLCPPLEINAQWISYGMDSSLVPDDHCNILLVPWPHELHPTQFYPINLENKSAAQKYTGQDHLGWFGFRHETGAVGKLINVVEKLLTDASKLVNQIHMVILPELALSRDQFDRLRDALFRSHKRRLILISGISDDTNDVPENSAVVAFPSLGELDKDYLQYEQRKHHRWKLDEGQITRYGLSSSLNPDTHWWEGIALTDRMINFYRLKPWLTTCVLLCEDLAQFDPMGRFVRSVAPDLVISLLMDGPQLASRWPARYATVLADDPGSSVLTLTSLGMTNLSRMQSKTAAQIPQTIALWKDPVSGPVSIELPAQSKAAVITVRQKESNEWSADGRPKTVDMGAPVFSGVQFL